MRTPRLPPLDTSGYISCPIGTPLLDLDQKSPLPCIIVTPSSPTEYHIAFHHKFSPLKEVSFATQQYQQHDPPRAQPRPRRAFLNALNPFMATPPPVTTTFNIVPPRRAFFEPRARTALVLAVPIFIIACHILVASLLRGSDLRSSLFGNTIARGGFSGAAAHMRAQRDAQPPPQPQISISDLRALD